MMLNIIPYPNKILEKQGQFLLTDHITIMTCDATNRLVKDFANYINQNYGINVKLVDDQDNTNWISFNIVDQDDSTLDESYKILVGKDAITIEAVSKKGMFYAIQTLKQLIEKDKAVYIPCVEIDDTPSFSWRGFMLDESRHFFGKQFVLKLIDILSFYKINILHWHLTDDQGWRIEIKKYPKLTEVGGWRTEKNEKYGGYYTQEEIKEVIDYARDQFVTIIPEIDIPGHFSAAIASYPYLSCSEDNIEVPSYYGILKHVACAGKDSIYKFAFDVLDEVCELFPSEYIHIGGDEVPKDSWKKCHDCKRMIKNENLQNEEELQGYLTNVITDYLNKKGRKVMVWNDILKAKNLNDDVIVHHWFDGISRKNTIKSINQGRKAVMSDIMSLYFDYPNEVITLKKVYNYNPIQKKVKNSDNILGIQANLWTEHIKDVEKAQEMIFPRMQAVCEVAWTDKSVKNYDSFLCRMKYHYKYLVWFDVNAFMYDKVKPSPMTFISSLIKHFRTMAKGAKK